ncbi:MAG: DNA-processing protein DprA [Candidatus Nanoarchaeia archaeon]
MLSIEKIVGLLSIPGISYKVLGHLCENPKSYDDLDEIYDYISNRVKRFECVGFKDFKKKFEINLEKFLHAQQLGIRAIALHEKDYPRLLRKIANPPLVLFVKGSDESLKQENKVAVIGTRKPTSNGYKLALKVSEYVTEKGFVVVSGLAEGCDSSAHEGCLAKGGRTIAVLAHGLDKVYPSKNKSLAEKIIEQGGCLISEYPVGMPAKPNQFVARNRIQSGLSLGVIVVEASLESGSMHTVNFCLEQKRLLGCCVPTEANANQQLSSGVAEIIRKGAFVLNEERSIDIFIQKMLASLANPRNSDVRDQSDLFAENQD